MSDWKFFVMNPESECTAKEIRVTIGFLMDELHNNGVKNLDFSFATKDNISVEHLMASLRTTFRFRESIRGWRHASLICYEVLLTKGKPADKIMKGLM